MLLHFAQCMLSHPAAMLIFQDFSQFFYRCFEQPQHDLTGIRVLTFTVMAPESLLELIGHCLVAPMPIESASFQTLFLQQFQSEPEEGKNR